MRRTGSEEIGSSKAFGRGNHFWRTEGFAFSDFFGEAPERRPWITEHDDAGRSLPGFIFAFVFYWLELPTDCAIQPYFYSSSSLLCSHSLVGSGSWRKILVLRRAPVLNEFSVTP